MTLTAEQLEIRALARDFAENEIRPHAEAWDADREIPESLFAKLSELGFMGMRVPEAYGGLELDLPTYLLVLQELAWGDASVAMAVATHNGPVPAMVLAHGTDQQKEAWLPRLASGEVLGTLAAGELAATGDTAEVAVQARDSGEGWTLSGTMPQVVNGTRAGLVVALARTGDGAFGCFLLAPGTDGYGAARRLTTMGHRALELVDVRLDEVVVPSDALLGDPNRGLAHATDSLVVGRAGVAAQGLGIAQAALEHAVRYALERKQFGRSLAAFDATQAKLGNMAARIAGDRASLMELGERLQRRAQGEPDLGSGTESLAVRAAGAKLLASETAMYAADEAVQIFGGYGYMRDYPVERLMRDAKGTEIFQGTSETLRRAISSEIIRAASDA